LQIALKLLVNHIKPIDQLQPELSLLIDLLDAETGLSQKAVLEEQVVVVYLESHDIFRIEFQQ
jgi:hypothetical protein